MAQFIQCLKQIGIWNSSIGIVPKTNGELGWLNGIMPVSWAGQLKNQSSSLGRGKKLFSLSKSPDKLWGPPNFPYVYWGGGFLWVYSSLGMLSTHLRIHSEVLN
jgi:hypothetical protein